MEEIKLSINDYKKVAEILRHLDIPYQVSSKIQQDYQRKKSKYYLGSDSLYKEILYTIRQYPIYKKQLTVIEAEATAINCNINDVYIKSLTQKSKVEIYAVKIADLKNKIETIDRSITVIPDEYKKGVWEHVVYKLPYSNPIFDLADISTYKKWCQKFIYTVAVNLGYKDLIDFLKEEI